MTPNSSSLRMLGTAVPVIIAAVLPAAAQDGGLSGPSSTAAELEPGDGLTDPRFRSDFPRSVLAGFYDWKDVLAENGVKLGFDYLSLGQWSDSALGAGEASGGIARLFGTFDLGAGHSLTFKVENRHAYGTVAPQFLGFDAGALSITGTAFNDSQAILTNLFWTYRDPEARFTLQAGQIDVTDFLDVYGLVSPYTAFQNLSFNTNPTINAVPA